MPPSKLSTTNIDTTIAFTLIQLQSYRNCVAKNSGSGACGRFSAVFWLTPGKSAKLARSSLRRPPPRTRGELVALTFITGARTSTFFRGTRLRCFGDGWVLEVPTHQCDTHPTTGSLPVIRHTKRHGRAREIGHDGAERADIIHVVLFE